MVPCKWCNTNGKLPNPFCPHCGGRRIQGSTVFGQCPQCSQVIPRNHMSDCVPCQGTGYHPDGTSDSYQKALMENMPETSPEHPHLKVVTVDLPANLWTLRDGRLTAEERSEVGVELDITTGEYLGLIFTSEEMTKRFIYLRGLKKTTPHALTFNRLVFAARRLLKEGALKEFVLDHTGHASGEVKSFFVRDIASIRVKEDTWVSKGM